MKVPIKVTNENLYHKMVVDIDCSGLKNRGTNEKNESLGFYGDLSIELENGVGWITYSGQFLFNDYKEEFGFIIYENLN